MAVTDEDITKLWDDQRRQDLEREHLAARTIRAEERLATVLEKLEPIVAGARLSFKEALPWILLGAGATGGGAGIIKLLPLLTGHP